MTVGLDTSSEVALALSICAAGLGIVTSIAAWALTRQINAMDAATKDARAAAKEAHDRANEAYAIAAEAGQWVKWLGEDYKGFKGNVVSRETINDLKEDIREVKRDVRGRIMPGRYPTPYSEPPKKG